MNLWLIDMNIENMNKSKPKLYNGLREFNSSDDFNLFDRMHYAQYAA